MFQQRLEFLCKIVADAGLDAVALMPGHNLAYLTGVHFHLLERPIVGFFLPQGEPLFVIPEMEVVNLQSANPFPLRFFSYSDAAGHDGAFAAAAEALGLDGKRIGVEGLVMRVFEQRILAWHFPGVTILDAGEALAALRLRKSAAEVGLMRQAIRITEDAIRQVLAGVRAGMSEQAIANELVIAMLRGGGGALAFSPIVLSGPKSALPHGNTGDRSLSEGDILLVDIGTTVGGYVSDIIRTFVLGELHDSRLRDAYAAVLAANEGGRKAAGPGVPCQEVDRAARAEIERAGLGEYFVHRTGHGLGMDAHEGPYVREGNTQRLEPGHVITVEPGVYLPGVGGIRIEDDVLITADGAESLTTFPRALQSVGG